MARAAAAAAWAAAITAFAVALHYARPTGALAKVASSEPAHVAAHLLLYGALAALVARALRGWSWKVFALVAAAGLLQEAAQTLFFGVAMGRHEAYDFSVDLAGCAAALAAARAWRWRAERGGEAVPARGSPSSG